MEYSHISKVFREIHSSLIACLKVQVRLLHFDCKVQTNLAQFHLNEIIYLHAHNQHSFNDCDEKFILAFSVQTAIIPQGTSDPHRCRPELTKYQTRGYTETLIGVGSNRTFCPLKIKILEDLFLASCRLKHRDENWEPIFPQAKELVVIIVSMSLKYLCCEVLSGGHCSPKIARMKF